MGNVLGRLERWFQTHCDGWWENDNGITVESCDNPGWWVRIDLKGTNLEGKPFAKVVRGDESSLDPAPPWLRCYVENSQFNGLGDPTTLTEILELFLDWAEEPLS